MICLDGEIFHFALYIVMVALVFLKPQIDVRKPEHREEGEHDESRRDVLDASALFAFLQKTPGACKVSKLSKEALRGHAKVLMPAVNYGEAHGKLLREHGRERAL